MTKEVLMKTGKKEEDIEIISFDNEALPIVLNLFNNEVTDEGTIIDDTLKEPIKDEFSGKELNLGNFGGVMKGSRVYISTDISSLAEYVSRYCNKDNE